MTLGKSTGFYFEYTIINSNPKHHFWHITIHGTFHYYIISMVKLDYFV